jgi:hypothetical protein
VVRSSESQRKSFERYCLKYHFLFYLVALPIAACGTCSVLQFLY